MTVKCTCIDDRNKPAEIPSRLWVKADEEYHITSIYWHPLQGVQGVDLLEVALDDSCQPYETYQLRRFAIKPEDLPQFIELARLCNELDEVDVEKLMEECMAELVPVEMN